MTFVFSLFRRTRAAQTDKVLLPRGFEPGASRMPDKRRTSRLQLPYCKTGTPVEVITGESGKGNQTSTGNQLPFFDKQAQPGYIGHPS